MWCQYRVGRMSWSIPFWRTDLAYVFITFITSHSLGCPDCYRFVLNFMAKLLVLLLMKGDTTIK